MKLLIHTGYYVGLLMIVLLTSCLKKDDSLTVLIWSHFKAGGFPPNCCADKDNGAIKKNNKNE
jgi:hypothetical protein